MRILLILISAIFCISCGSGDKSKKQLAVLTIPKSGTHLTEKYFYLLKQIHPEVQKPMIAHFYDHGNAPIHLPSNVIEKVGKGQELYPVFVIRDLWDKMVSALDYDDQSLFPGRKMEGSRWRDPSKRSENLMQRIQSESGFNKYVEKLQEFEKLYSKYYLVRFEDLVGPQGGGDQATQLKIVHELASYCDISITDDEASWIASNLFGKEGAPSRVSFSFYKGKVER